MIHEFKLIFHRGAGTGVPYLLKLDPESGEATHTEVEDLILASTRDSDTGLPVLVRFDDCRDDIDLEKVFRADKVRRFKKKDIYLLDGSGRKARAFKVSQNAIYPYVLMVETDDGPMPAAFSADGTCASGRRADDLVRVCTEDIATTPETDTDPED